MSKPVSKSFQCPKDGHTIRILKCIQWVSGIGDDSAIPVELQRTCSDLKQCPWVQECPLLTEDLR